jgi:uncharacterized membrane protein
VKDERLPLLAGTCLAAALTLITAILALPQALRVAVGVPMVLLLPGYALVCVLLPGPRLSRSECLLVSVGASLAMTTCACVLLGATPVGLSRESLAVLLGSGTVTLSLVAGVRRRRLIQLQRRYVTDSGGSEP